MFIHLPFFNSIRITLFKHMHRYDSIFKKKKKTFCELNEAFISKNRVTFERSSIFNSPKLLEFFKCLFCGLKTVILVDLLMSKNLVDDLHNLGHSTRCGATFVDLLRRRFLIHFERQNTYDVRFLYVEIVLQSQNQVLFKKV